MGFNAFQACIRWLLLHSPPRSDNLHDLLQLAALTVGTDPTSTYLLGAVPAKLAGLDV